MKTYTITTTITTDDPLLPLAIRHEIESNLSSTDPHYAFTVAGPHEIRNEHVNPVFQKILGEFVR